LAKYIKGYIMRVQDILRRLADVIDRSEQPAPEEHKIQVVVAKPEVPQDEDELARIKQIAGLLPTGDVDQYVNEPQEAYADIEAVTASGTDVHRSKHPSDIRGDSISMYPGHQHRPGM
jgi:hypothetical protein